ncbi:MAG: hypothetical protein PHF86_03035 [Candidatus Nanoarchaeia archaeon]|jgi:hypothetical protein|nr:hypothetical protein [Candidatus Nanoarchaeia archaeon]
MSEQFMLFIEAQKHAIEKAIFLDSQKENRDLRYDKNGNLSSAYFIEWINNHASEFRDAWELSTCRKCKKVSTCYDCLRTSCDSFVPF